MQTSIPTSTTILRSGDAGYTERSAGFNTSLDVRPAAVALPTDAEQVAIAVRTAAAEGLKVAVASGGHNLGPLGDLSGSMLVRTDALGGVKIDPVARRARVGAGVRWGEVVEAAAPYGLAALHGSSPTVGVAGFSLGGGVGWFARQHGLQTRRLTAVDLVTADGRLRRVDDATDPELMWALRGGGGNFGIATALEFELFPVPDAYAGWLAWDWTHADTVLHAWREWTQGLDPAVTTAARILRLPPDPALPEPIRGRQLVVVSGAILACDDRSTELLRPLRELGPELDTFARVPASALARLHGDPEEPLPYVTAHRMLRTLPASAIDAMVAVAGPAAEAESMVAIAELRHVGAEAAVSDPKAACGALDGEYIGFSLVPLMAPGIEAAAQAQCEGVMQALAGAEFGVPYLNFVEDAIDPAAGWRPDVHRRLRATKADVDPLNLFTANHGI